MKKIEAIVRLSQFDEIRDGLATIDVNFFTLSKVEGFGLEKGEKIRYRGSSYDSKHVARLKLEILVVEEKVDEVVQVIVDKGRTGEVGDGKIMVFAVEKSTRIRTGEEGRDAILPSS
ncbi:MAG: P-II family nitrogen regulator [Bacteroidota bacterium]